MALYHGDHANPDAHACASLAEEIGRVVRSRVVNPKWIAGARRHGYKGAAEMAATVDYLFGYDAATDVVEDYQYAHAQRRLSAGRREPRSFWPSTTRARCAR